MARWTTLCCVLELGCAGAHAQTVNAPLTPAQRALVDRMAEYARGYEKRVPDFVCTRVTRRSRAKPGSGERWKPLDTSEEELTVVKGRESFRLLKLNGKPAKPSTRQASGFRSNGEFAGVLAGIFGEGKNAEIRWERDEDWAGRHIGVFRVRVPKERSHATVDEGGKKEIVGFGGLVYAAGDTGAVERVHLEQDAPEGLNAGGMTTDVRFVEVTIAGELYLLPGQAETRIRYNGALLKRDMEFRDFHKYVAGSSVVFDTPE
jgi:hypothetical protein